VWEIVRALVAEGTTVLLCTQYLEEADQLADGIAVIDHGRVIAEGTPAQLKASVGSGRLRVRLVDPQQRPAPSRCCAGASPTSCSRPTRRRCPSRARTPTAARTAVGELARSGVRVAEFALGQPSLDEVFLALTGAPAVPQQPTSREEQQA
jgi:ABC-2 type transport system ATP-binding protein